MQITKNYTQNIKIYALDGNQLIVRGKTSDLLPIMYLKFNASDKGYYYSKIWHKPFRKI